MFFVFETCCSPFLMFDAILQLHWSNVDILTGQSFNHIWIRLHCLGPNGALITCWTMLEKMQVMNAIETKTNMFLELHQVI